MATLLSDLTTRVYRILTLPVDINTVPLTYVQDLCNEFEFMITKGMKFPFLRERHLFRTFEDTTLAGNITTASTSVLVPTGKVSSGESYIIIDEDVINYTGITTGATNDTLTGVTGIAVSHSTGDTVRQLYTVPTTYSHQGDLFVDDVFHEYVQDIDGTDDNFIRRRWQLVQTDDGEMFQIERVIDDKIAYFNYYKGGGNMTTAATASVVPDNWATQTISTAVARAIKLFKQQEQRAEFLMAEAERVRSKMRAHYGTRNNAQKPKTTFGRYGSRRNFSTRTFNRNRR